MSRDDSIHDTKSKRYKSMKSLHAERRKKQRKKAKTKKK